MKNDVPAYYLDSPGEQNEHVVLQLIKRAATWVIIFTNMVPISLMVQLEICKLAQATMMSNDYEIYDEEQEALTKA